jgi:hypothetical protein
MFQAFTPISHSLIRSSRPVDASSPFGAKATASTPPLCAGSGWPIACPLVTSHNITASNFARDRVFVEFLHDVISRCGASSTGLVAAAKSQVEGWVYVLDGRTPTPQDSVPPEDILGAFQVKAGQLESLWSWSNGRGPSTADFLSMTPSCVDTRAAMSSACWRTAPSVCSHRQRRYGLFCRPQ